MKQHQIFKIILSILLFLCGSFLSAVALTTPFGPWTNEIIGLLALAFAGSALVLFVKTLANWK